MFLQISRMNQSLDEELEKLAHRRLQEAYLPRKADNDCLTELRWIYDRRSIEEAHEDLAA
jgi:transposase-like protein